MMQATHVLKNWVCIPPVTEFTSCVATRRKGFGFRLHGLLVKHPFYNAENQSNFETSYWDSTEVVGVDDSGYVNTKNETVSDAHRYAFIDRFDWNWINPAHVRLFNEFEKQYLTETVIPLLAGSSKVVHSRLAEALKSAIGRQLEIVVPNLTGSSNSAPQPPVKYPIPEVMLLFIVNNIHLIMFSGASASCNNYHKQTGTKTGQSSTIQTSYNQKKLPD